MSFLQTPLRSKEIIHAEILLGAIIDEPTSTNRMELASGFESDGNSQVRILMIGLRLSSSCLTWTLLRLRLPQHNLFPFQKAEQV